MAGPWFTVEESGDDWQELGQMWLSNGKVDCRARIELRLALEEADHVAQTLDSKQTLQTTASGHE